MPFSGFEQPPKSVNLVTIPTRFTPYFSIAEKYLAKAIGAVSPAP